MDTDEDVRERIERSFGEGPAEGPVGDLLEQGHRALARRRLTVVAVSAAAVVAVLGGAAALDGGGGTDRAQAPGFAATATATEPAPSTEPSVTKGAEPTNEQIHQALQRPLAGYDGRGRLVL